jgi:DNA primase
MFSKKPDEVNKKLKEPIISNGVITLTREDVIKHYMKPEVVDSITKFIGDANVMVNRFFNGQMVIQKKIDNRPIKIKETGHDLDNPNNYYYYVPRHTVEFHYIYPEKSHHVTIDIDPNKVPFSVAKQVTKHLYDYLSDKVDGKMEVRYSGGRGFYITIYHNKPIDVNEYRKRLTKIFEPIVEKVDFLTLKPPQEGQIRIDLSTIHEGGSIRAPYSLHAETGLVSVPVDIKKIDAFNPLKDAHPRIKK